MPLSPWPAQNVSFIYIFIYIFIYFLSGIIQKKKVRNPSQKFQHLSLKFLGMNAAVK